MIHWRTGVSKKPACDEVFYEALEFLNGLYKNQGEMTRLIDEESLTD